MCGCRVARLGEEREVGVGGGGGCGRGREGEGGTGEGRQLAAGLGGNEEEGWVGSEVSEGSSTNHPRCSLFVKASAAQPTQNDADSRSETSTTVEERTES